MNDISGYGSLVNIQASNTFPLGIALTQFADDSDPLDIPSVQIAEAAMGLNGDLISWSKANVIKVTVNVIPHSFNDIELGILLQANRVGRGKIGAKDIITMTAVFPDFRFITLIEGIITDGMPASSIASAGRQKSKSYTFAFENYVEAGG